MSKGKELRFGLSEPAWQAWQEALKRSQERRAADVRRDE